LEYTQDGTNGWTDRQTFESVDALPLSVRKQHVLSFSRIAFLRSDRVKTKLVHHYELVVKVEKESNSSEPHPLTDKASNSRLVERGIQLQQRSLDWCLYITQDKTNLICILAARRCIAKQSKMEYNRQA